RNLLLDKIKYFFTFNKKKYFQDKKMDREKIIKLSKKNIDYSNLEKAKNILEKNYDVSYGRYEPGELKKIINNGSPFVIENNLIIGFDPADSKKFINSDKEAINIERMVKAIVVEDEIEPVEDTPSDLFVIINKMDWENDPVEFMEIFGDLRVGAIFLPPHSAIFNFLQPTPEQVENKIVSMLEGVNINIYDKTNYIDNAIHEMGHLYYRDRLTAQERKAFDSFYNRLKPSAIYEFMWEKSTPEEVFCTIYKWYLKSILINKSFYNILEFEEPEGLDLLQKIFDRVSQDQKISGIWEMNKAAVFDYLNPVFDKTTMKYLRKAGSLEITKTTDIPREYLNDLVSYVDGIEFIQLEKTVVPVKDNRIDIDNLSKARTSWSVSKDKIYVDLDGVVADFSGKYQKVFNRSAFEDDPFTVQQHCLTVNNFFRDLDVIPKGRELVDSLKDTYKVVFLTTPMADDLECKRDKLEWVRDNFGPEYDVIFSSQKDDYVIDEQSVLIDDMDYNLKPWEEAGGTAINFNKKNEKILAIIEDVFNDKKHIEKVRKQLDDMVVDTDPSEAQKESGNYKKGEIVLKGLRIKIENPKNSIRWGIGFNGQKWITKMKAHYGYITGFADAMDGDKMDVFIGDKLNASRCFIVNQVDHGTGMFDEHKVVMAVDNINEAEDLYMSCYQKGWKGLGSIVQLNTKLLREWLSQGNFSEPYRREPISA
ncbi:MAG: hypothetical protein ACFFDN_04825, partial [Candidatus Hodarchaeota archaeon]